MSRRKSVVAWAVVYENGSRCLYNSRTLAYSIRGLPARVVKLVEHDPAVDAVVRTARGWFRAMRLDGVDDYIHQDDASAALDAAVTRLEKKGSGR